MDPFTLTLTDEAGRSVHAWVTPVGDDIVIAIGGGERPHVGSLVLAQPRPSRSRPGEYTPSISVLTIPPHKEEPMARGVAEAVSRRTGRVVTVTAGVHDDAIDLAGIRGYLRLVERLAEELAERIPPLESGGSEPG
jgi:hypothetical protein